MLIAAFIGYFIASWILLYHYRKLRIAKNQIRLSTIKNLQEEKNYLYSTVCYSIILSCLSYLLKFSYEHNELMESFFVASFIGLLIISRNYFFSLYGLRSLKELKN